MDIPDIQFNFVNQTGLSAAAALKQSFLPLVLERLPFVQDKGLIFLFGSAARGRTQPGSDIDVMLLLPDAVMSAHAADLESFAAAVWQRFSIDLSWSLPVETLFSDQAWNNDFLLHVLTEALGLYDPQTILLDRQAHFASLPDEVRRDKLIFLGKDIISSLARLERQVARNDELGAAAMRCRIIKENLILLHLLHGNVFDLNNLYPAIQKHPQMSRYAGLVVRCLSVINSQECEDLLAHLTQSVQEEIVGSGLLPAQFYATWDPLKQPLTYRVLLTRL